MDLIYMQMKAIKGEYTLEISGCLKKGRELDSEQVAHMNQALSTPTKNNVI